MDTFASAAAARLSRRTFLTRAGLGAIAASTGLLSACSDGEQEESAAAEPTSAPEPTATTVRVSEDPTPTVVSTQAPTPVPDEEPEEPPTPTVVSTQAPTPVPDEEPEEPPTPTAEPEPTAVPEEPAPPNPAELRATWTQLGSGEETPAARRDHSLVSNGDGNRVYLFGGHSSGADLADLWVYDVEASLWEQIVPAGPGPAPRFGHSAAYDPTSDQMFIFGGQTGPDFYNDVWAFDTASGEWAQLASGESVPEARYGSGDAFDPASGLFYITHGFTFQGRFDDTWAFSTADEVWNDVSPADGERPLERCLLRSAFDSTRSRLLLFGGQSNVASFHGDFWAFDVQNRVWSELPGGPSPRHLYSLVTDADNGYLVLFGGKSESGEQNDVWLYDLGSDGWFSLPVESDSPAGRNGHDAAWLPDRNQMILFGGRADGEFNDLWSMKLG